LTDVGTSRWAKYGKLGVVIPLVVAVVVGAANIDGFLSLVERVFGTSDSPNSMFNFGDSLDLPGSYRLSVNVVTDGGQTGAGSADFTVT
jgi:hypothetical protein